MVDFCTPLQCCVAREFTLFNSGSHLVVHDSCAVVAGVVQVPHSGICSSHLLQTLTGVS